MAEVDKEITVKVKAEDDTQKATQSAKARLRDLQKQMLDLESAGQKNTDQFRKMAAEAGSLKDAIGDTSAQVKVLASDTRTLDTFTSAIQGIAGGFAVAQGAAALFGEENEDVQKAMMKVQAALALVNGATAVANALNKDSALMVNLNAAAQRAYALAVGTSTGALRAFRIALVTTGIGAVVVALGFAIEAMLRFTNKTEDQTDAQKDLNKTLFESVNMLDLYERKLKAEGATEEQIARVRMARFERDLETSRSVLAVLRAQMKAGSTQAQRDLELQYMQEIELLKVKIAEENRIIKDAREARALQAKADFEKRKKENEVEFMTERTTLQEHLEKLRQTRALAELQFNAQRRYGIKEMLADEKAFNEARISMYSIAAGSIVEIMRSLGGKSKGVMLAALALEKAAAIAQVLVNLQKEKSAISANVPNTVASPDFGLAAKSAMIKLATISAGFRIAAIAATGLSQARGITGDSGGSGGGMSVPSGMAAPQGNAMNPNSQLLNPNTGQAVNPQPLRAYVVESDVSGIQNRLRTIRQFAQLGN